MNRAAGERNQRLPQPDRQGFVAIPALTSLPLDGFDLAPDQVRERFRWAASQGKPQWLWPDVSEAAWGVALQRIEAATRETMVHGRASAPLDGDAAVVGLAAYTSGMGPLLGRWAAAGKLACSEPVAAILALHLSHNRARMARMAARALAVSEALFAAGVAHTFLKGMHTAYAYFPDPATRPLSDIDLLIGPGDERGAGEALRGCGFVPGVARTWPRERSWRIPDSPAQPRSLCFTHADDPWTIDLHMSLDRRYAAAAPVIRLDETAAFVRPGRWPLSPNGQALAQPLLLLHLTVHAGCGLDSLTMLRLVELALVIRADFAADPDAWDAFLDAAARTGAPGSCYPGLWLCEKLVPGSVPGEVMERIWQAAPPKVRQVVGPMGPANAQRVSRCSLTERFMWAPSPGRIAWQVLAEIFPPGSASIGKLLSTYRKRLWRLARRTLTQ